MHLNDSKTPFASRRDRHELIGEGSLGEEPFRRIMTDERLARVPKVIETPKLDDDMLTDSCMLHLLRGFAAGMSAVDSASDRERIAALEAAMAREHRLQAALDGAGQFVWDYDCVTGEVYRSAGWSTMLGYDEAPFDSSLAHWMEIAHPDDQKIAYESFRKFIEGRDRAARIRVPSSQCVGCVALDRVQGKDHRASSGRQTAQGGRHIGRHHRAKERGGRARDGEAGGGARESREERVPREHEP